MLNACFRFCNDEDQENLVLQKVAGNNKVGTFGQRESFKEKTNEKNIFNYGQMERFREHMRKNGIGEFSTEKSH